MAGLQYFTTNKVLMLKASNLPTSGKENVCILCECLVNYQVPCSRPIDPEQKPKTKWPLLQGLRWPKPMRRRSERCRILRHQSVPIEPRIRPIWVHEPEEVGWYG